MAIQSDYNQHWRGPFDSWQEALQEATHSDSAWTNQDWIRRQMTFLESAATSNIHSPPRPSFLPIVAGMLNASRIVDYGGGSGWAFALVNDSCPDLRINSYSVLELPSVIKELGKFANIDSRITYLPFEDVELISEADLLYSNASLHYGETEKSFFDAALTLGPVSHILLDGYLAHPEREFYCLQNVWGDFVPVRIPYLDHSLQTMADHGFQVTSCIPMLGPVGGVYGYGLPLDHFGSTFAGTKRYCITATRRILFNNLGKKSH